MKTPEKMAEEWYGIWHKEQDFIGPRLGTERAFVAGYQAAKDLYEVKLKEADDTIAGMADECEGLKTIIYDHDETNLPTSAKWISVKDRLPEDWECCLWWASSYGQFDCGWKNNECINLRCKTGCGQQFDAGAIFICEFHSKDKDYEQHYLIDDASNVAFIDCFSHWMPLPEAPKEEG